MPDRRAVVAALLIGSIVPKLSLAQTAAAPASLFAWQNGFWRNLHQTLYAFGTHDTAATRARRIRLAPADTTIRETLAPAMAATWSDAVRWYAETLTPRNLLFDNGMIAIGRILGARADDKRLASDGLPERLHETLTAAAPVYRAHWWSAHRRANAAWRDAAMPLVSQHGRIMATRLSDLLGVDWPAVPIEVALTAYANSAGSYTVVDPAAITLATSDASYQGPAALEMLIHEGGHALARPMRDRLAELTTAAAARPGAEAAAIRSDLWHEILFYVAGRIAADAMPGYMPYADRNELWRIAWPGRDRDVLARHLDPVVAGRTPLDTALIALVDDLAAVPAAT